MILYALLWVTLIGWLANLFLWVQFIRQSRRELPEFSSWIKPWVVGGAVWGGSILAGDVFKSIVGEAVTPLGTWQGNIDLFIYMLYMYGAPAIWIWAADVFWRDRNKAKKEIVVPSVPEDGAWPPAPEMLQEKKIKLKKTRWK